MSEKNTLSIWQEKFTQSLLSTIDPQLQKDFNASSQQANEQRFSIYQNNVFHSLTKALSDLYPVVNALVGDDFFMGTAGVYLRAHPPQQAAMVHFATDFPEFLRHFEHTAKLTYLAPVASLELARHQAYHAQDMESVAAEDIAKVPADTLAHATVTLHPSLRVITSNHPIFSIWESNQNNNESEDEDKTPIDVDEPQAVLIVRPYDHVIMYSIDTGMALFLRYLSEERTITEALELVLQAINDFDPSKAVHFIIEAKLLTAIKK